MQSVGVNQPLFESKSTFLHDIQPYGEKQLGMTSLTRKMAGTDWMVKANQETIKHNNWDFNAER